MSGHKFDPAQLERLDNPQRRAVLPPQQVIQAIGVDKSQVWADIGCGAGYFSLPLADTVDKVYAVDISDQMLAKLQAKLAENRVTNVSVQKSAESVIPLPRSSVDGVLLALVVHELNEPEQMLPKIAGLLKIEGRLIIIEWVNKPTKMGPPVHHRLSTEQIDAWALSAGLEKMRTLPWADMFVLLEYGKKQPEI